MGVFNETIFPLTRVGYEMITANSCPTSARGIVVKYKKAHALADLEACGEHPVHLA